MKNATIIIMLIIGLIAGIAICSLFKGNKLQCPETAVAVKNFGDVKQTILSDEKLNTVIDSFKQKSQIIDKQLKKTKQALNKSQQANTILQTRLYILINSKDVDTATQLTTCDSLKKKMVMLLRHDDIKDSLQTIISNYREEKDNAKDSILQTQQLQYSLVKAAWNKSLEQQQTLSTQNKLMEQQIRKQKIKSKFIAAGLLAIAGFTSHYLLTH